MREKSFRVFTRIVFASILALALSTVVLAQGGGRGGGGGSHPGGGPGAGGSGRADDSGFPSRTGGNPGDRPSGRPDGDRRNGSDGADRARENGNNADKEIHRHPDIAKALNTTPEQLRSQYQAALASNPNLKFGQFIAANLIANNLNANHPNVTTDAILSGLASGKSLGETLQSLGLSTDEAKEAEREARKAGKHKS